MNFSEVKIRIYRACENREACLRFSEGHSNVLKSYNIKKVTSANTSWYQDPDVYLIMIESKDGKIVHGGARFHLKNDFALLPLEEALIDLDPEIVRLTKPGPKIQTGEMCGMWNRRDAAGNGLSKILMRAGIAKCTIYLTDKYNIKSVFALCAPWTTAMCEELGFRIEKSVGLDGKFNYPTPELVAVVYSLQDVERLEKASYSDREGIFDLRKNPIQRKIETGPKGSIEIEYDLIMQHELNSFSTL